MPLDVLLPDTGQASPQPSRPPTSCVFVNNMPDGAFAASERQILGLVEAGCGPCTVEVRRYAMPGVPRGARIAQRIAENYFPVSQLWESSPEILIVTGSEPLASTLQQEAYWDDLVRLLRLSVQQGTSLLLSCLSAHAALALFDGLPRVLLPVKCTGVFPQEIYGDHPLTAGLGPDLVMPHSRLNDVAVTGVRDAGYEVLLGSEEVGWSLVTKQIGQAQVLLVQGHPEYDASSLLREYHRDVDRYLSGSRHDPPVLPAGCVASQDAESLRHFHQRLVTSPPQQRVGVSFPFEEAAARAGWPWRASATKLYANWLAAVLSRST